MVIRIGLLKSLAEKWAEFLCFERGIMTKFCDDQSPNIFEWGGGK